MPIEEKYKSEAKELCDAIKRLADDPEKLENFQWYLELHLETWFEKFVTSPEGLISEFQLFAEQ